MLSFKEIKSKDNSLIKLTSELQKSAKKRGETGLFCLEGLRICNDAFDNGIKFDKLIISETAGSKLKIEIERLTSISNEGYILPDSLFKRISETESPQGIIALAVKPNYNSSFNSKGRYIALENIQDPSNLGAIARSCEALGADGLILSKGCCDPYAPKSLRASMGTLLRIPVIFTDDFINDINSLGLKSFACVVDKEASPISSAEFKDGCALLIGNEANGLTQNTIENSDFRITIPMKGKAESLNAAVAASISIWEMMK